MKELGVKVLTKIEDLISVIDKPASPKRKKNKLNGNDISFGQSDVNTDSKIYLKKLSYNYLHRQKKNNNIIKSQIYQEEKQISPFKITNKKTIQILNRKQIKPLYQRLDQIVSKKKHNIENIQRMNLMRQIESMKPQHIIADYNAQQQRKMSIEELEEFRTDLNERNIERIKKKHFLELNNVKKQVFNGIPQIAKGSRSLSKIHMKKNNYSQDVFERLLQDTLDRNQRKKQFVKEVEQEEGGYQPVLCAKSRILAQRSKSKNSIFAQSVDSLCHSKCKQKRIPKPNTSTEKSFNKHNKQNPQRNHEISNRSQNIPKKQLIEKKGSSVKNKLTTETNKGTAIKQLEKTNNIKRQSSISKSFVRTIQNKSTVKKQNNTKVSPIKGLNKSKQILKQNQLRLIKK